MLKLVLAPVIQNCTYTYTIQLYIYICISVASKYTTYLYLYIIYTYIDTCIYKTIHCICQCRCMCVCLYLCICLFMNIDHMLFYITTKRTYSSVDINVDLPHRAIPWPGLPVASWLARRWTYGDHQHQALEYDQKMGKQASHNGDLANKSTNNGRRWGWVKLHRPNLLGWSWWKAVLKFHQRRERVGETTVGFLSANMKDATNNEGTTQKALDGYDSSHYRDLLVSEALTHPHVLAAVRHQVQWILRLVGTHGTLVYLHENMIYFRYQPCLAPNKNWQRLHRKAWHPDVGLTWRPRCVTGTDPHWHRKTLMQIDWVKGR